MSDPVPFPYAQYVVGEIPLYRHAVEVYDSVIDQLKSVDQVLYVNGNDFCSEQLQRSIEMLESHRKSFIEGSIPNSGLYHSAVEKLNKQGYYDE